MLEEDREKKIKLNEVAWKKLQRIPGSRRSMEAVLSPVESIKADSRGYSAESFDCSW